MDAGSGFFITEGKEGRIEDDISETKYNDDNSIMCSYGEDDIMKVMLY